MGVGIADEPDEDAVVGRAWTGVAIAMVAVGWAAGADGGAAGCGVGWAACTPATFAWPGLDAGLGTATWLAAAPADAAPWADDALEPACACEPG